MHTLEQYQLGEPNFVRTVHASLRAIAERNGFSPSEAFALATAAIAKAHDAPDVSASASHFFTRMISCGELPDVVRPNGSMPSRRWKHCEARQRHYGHAV